jgi:hypothetical protein
MPEPKKETIQKGPGRAIIIDKVRSHANDPFFVKKNQEAGEAFK